MVRMRIYEIKKNELQLFIFPAMWVKKSFPRDKIYFLFGKISKGKACQFSFTYLCRAWNKSDVVIESFINVFKCFLMFSAQ